MRRSSVNVTAGSAATLAVAVTLLVAASRTGSAQETLLAAPITVRFTLYSEARSARDAMTADGTAVATPIEFEGAWTFVVRGMQGDPTMVREGGGGCMSEGEAEGGTTRCHLASAAVRERNAMRDDGWQTSQRIAFDGERWTFTWQSRP